jgi:hypothetical protein
LFFFLRSGLFVSGADGVHSGMGVGSLAMIVPIYNSEVAPPEVRGALVATQQLAICFGIMVSFWID